MSVQFKKATKHAAKLRLAFVGPAGSGKTFSSLRLATALAAPGRRVAVIDSERGSASKYADKFDFDVLELESFSPSNYVEAIHAAEEAGYSVIVIDSLSHAWMGKDGAIEMVDKLADKSRGGGEANKFALWRHVTPKHNAMVDAIISSKCHVIATMRSKTEWVMERDPRTNKMAPRKIGLAPVQRDGLEYEFDVVGDLDEENVFRVTKTRCPDLRGAVIEMPGGPMAAVLAHWLGGEPRQEPSEEKLAEFTEKVVASQTQNVVPIRQGEDLERDLRACSSVHELGALVPRLNGLGEGAMKKRMREVYSEVRAGLLKRPEVVA